MDVNFLLDRCKDETGASTDGELAKRLGVSKQAMSSYRKGARLPDPVVCATIAGLSGLPLAKVLGIVGEARAISREEKAVWRKLAGMTAAILLFVGSAIGTPAKASTFDAIWQLQMHAQNSSGIYIMRNCHCAGSGRSPVPAGSASGPPPAQVDLALDRLLPTAASTQVDAALFNALRPHLTCTLLRQAPGHDCGED